jgi:hypothetical protein
MLGLEQNPPLKRLQYVAKTYGAKSPGVVLDTFFVLSDVVGIEHPELLGSAFQLWNDIAFAPTHGRNRRRVLLWKAGPDMPIGEALSVPARRPELAWGPDSPGRAARAMRSGYRRGSVSQEQLMQKILDEIERLSGEPPGHFTGLPEMRRGRDSDALWPWVGRELARAKKEALRTEDIWEYLGALNSLEGKGSALALWQKQERIDLGRLRLIDALDALEDFEVEGDVPQGKVEHQWPDGWTIQRLVDPEQLEAEGEIMQHCVGSYCPAVAAGQTIIYSLRDPKGKPHVTVEFNEQLNRFAQVQGKQNADPKPEYQSRVDEFADLRGINRKEGLTSKEYDKLYSEGQRIGNDAWQEAQRTVRFAIVDSETPDVPMDWYHVAGDVFPKIDPSAWEEAGLEGDLSDAIEEGAHEAWSEEHESVMRDLEDVVDQLVNDAREEGPDYDFEYEGQTALEESGLPYGNADVRYVINEAIAQY